MISLEDARRLCPAVEKLEEANRALEIRVARQQAHLDWYTRQLWGARSEKRCREILNLGQQLWLGQELMPVPVDPPPRSTTVKEYERQQRKKKTEVAEEDSQLRFGPDVPVEVIVVTDPEMLSVPEDERVLISTDTTCRLAQRSSYYVKKFVLQTWKRKNTNDIFTGRAPEGVVPGSSADASFLAGMLVDKFQFHLPLYRQHERLEQSGIYLSRGTLTRQVHRTAELLEPIYNALTSSILLSPLLAIDETPTPAGLKKGDAKNKGKIDKGYFWAFYGSHDEVCFLYSPSRARKVLDEFLGDYQGTLLTDGYGAYESFAKGNTGVLHAQCWSHSRRNFVYAEKAVPKQCAEALMIIQQLYAVEREAELGSEELRHLRNKKSRPIVDVLFNYLQREIAESIFLPSNAFHEAAQYMLKRRESLEMFLERPEIPLDTNHVERAIRPTVVGRKNWMFNFTETGARYSAMAYSLIQSCIAADVNPTTYFTDVLQRIAMHPAQDVHLLLPRLWSANFAAAPLT